MSTNYTNTYPSTGYASETQMRNEFTKVKTALDDTISRTGAAGDNAMHVDLDMNGNDILNAGILNAQDIYMPEYENYLMETLEGIYQRVHLEAEDVLPAIEGVNEAADRVQEQYDDISGWYPIMEHLHDETVAYADLASQYSANAGTASLTAINSANSAGTAAIQAEGDREIVEGLAEDVTEMASRVEDLYLDFDTKYLGAFTDDPTEDNNGNPILTGALYYNSATLVLMVYNGTVWEVPIITPEDLGTAALRDIGTGPEEVPLNKNLGEAAYRGVGINPTDLVQFSLLGGAASKDLASFSEATDGTPLKVIDAQVGKQAYWLKTDKVTNSYNADVAVQLQTPRNITVGSTSKPFDGTAPISFTVGEIGASPSNHTHTNILSAGTKSATTGSTKPDFTSGARVVETTSLGNGWPAQYGNILQVVGSNSSAGELFMGWNANADTGELRYRSLRNSGLSNWGSFQKILMDRDIQRHTSIASTAEGNRGYGYFILPGGVFVQWGQFGSTTDATQTFSFPIAFPTQCMSVTVDLMLGVSKTGRSRSSFILDRYNGIDVDVAFDWIAVGY